MDKITILGESPACLDTVHNQRTSAAWNEYLPQTSKPAMTARVLREYGVFAWKKHGLSLYRRLTAADLIDSHDGIRRVTSLTTHNEAVVGCTVGVRLNDLREATADLKRIKSPDRVSLFQALGRIERCAKAAKLQASEVDLDADEQED